MASSIDIPPDLYTDDADRSLLFSDTLVCNPCEEDGTSVPAHGYCTDCSEHLCVTCFSHHRTPKPCRNHKLLDKHQMPRTKAYTDKCTDKCEVHVGKILECFCEDHQQFVCTLCVITGVHKTCNVGYVPELSKDLFDSQEFKTFERNLNGIEERSINIETKSDETLDDTEKNTETSLDRIRQFRKEIDEFFDKLEQDVVEQATEIHQKNKGSTEEVKYQNKQLKKEIEEIQKTITEKKEKRQKCRLFADMKSFTKNLEKFSKEIKKLEEANSICCDVFSPSSDITNAIENHFKCFGHFQDITSANYKVNKKPVKFVETPVHFFVREKYFVSILDKKRPKKRSVRPQQRPPKRPQRRQRSQSPPPQERSLSSTQPAKHFDRIPTDEEGTFQPPT